MAEEAKSIGLSRKYISHPGVTLAEFLEERGMSQRELAVRTGMSEKHISTVIHGQKPISAVFAHKLEYALGVEAYFWMNLQADYDREIVEYEDFHSIQEEEVELLPKFKMITDEWKKCGVVRPDVHPAQLVMRLRLELRISNLCDIIKMPQTAVYRAQSNSNPVDPYVMFAWQRACELCTENIQVADEVDTEKLRNMLPEIKAVMFARTNQIQKKLTALFSECGIAFSIVPYYEGAPVQGLIKKSYFDKIMLCVAMRYKEADIFWFTLFHEIAHILNGDMDNLANDGKRGIVEFDAGNSDIETNANIVARNILINPDDYSEFVKARKYRRASDIKEFAESQNVKEYIVKGRLMKDGLIPWGTRPQYNWEKSVLLDSKD
ncbi:MAG: HigA family addiction module antitoxin [Clostridia bacterium]|nr:HigA family addiction module antitoxin [Clostridia bacterium]